MNPKNLPMKFVFLAVLVGICVLALATKGLKPGPDIAGGHSLVFQLSAGPDSGGDLNLRAIEVLKQRIDPDGLRNITFIPIGSDRIEIRMPASKESTRQAKREYIQAVNALMRRNITVTEMQALGRTSGDQRARQIERLAAGNEDLAKALAQLAQALDALQTEEQDVAQARKALTQAGEAYRQNETDENLQQREQARARLEQEEQQLGTVQTQLYKTQQAVKEFNVSQEGLERILELYVSAREARSLRDQDEQGREEIAQRREKFQNGIAAMKREHPHVAEQIEEISEKYKRWAENRDEISDPADLIRLVASAGVLEFRIAPKNPEVVLGDNMQNLITVAERRQYVDRLMQQGAASFKKDEPFRWFPVKGDGNELRQSALIVAGDMAGRAYVLLSNSPGRRMLREPGEDSWELTDARVTADQSGWPAVGFRFDERGAQLFNNLTTNNVGRNLAVLLDDTVYSAPVIQSVISDSGEITGRFTNDEVEDLVRILDAGTLPARLNPEPISQTSFESSLGEANKNRGIIAAWAGLIAVGLFMLIYYLYAGAIADVALVLNILLVLGAMSLMGAVFTLPGIAGIILTIGIAVDANVLIFERLREEQEKGQALRTALKNAYERAFSAILDANLTTLLTCVILGWVGTEEVRGFAITLGLGVLFSLFTAMIVTRWIFQALLQAGLIKQRVPMLRFMAPPKVNWMAKRKIFWAVSLVTVVLGLAALVGQGSRIFGIEFAGGTRTLVRFQDDALVQDQLPNPDRLREQIVTAATNNGYERLAATAQIEPQEDPGQVDRLLSRYDADNDGTITKQEWTSQGAGETYWQMLMDQGDIDADGNGTLSQQELAQMPTRVYQLSTTEPEFPKIKEVLNDALGDKLVQQTKLDYQIVQDRRFEPLNLQIDAQGITRITGNQIKDVTRLYQDIFREFDDGVLIVFTIDDRAISTAELQERLMAVREGHRRTEILPLAPDSVNDRLSSQFALLVAPPDDLDVGGWADFAKAEKTVLTDALVRSESTTTSFIGPSVAQDRAGLAIVAIVLSWLVIIIYLWKRFGSVQWGLAAVICLIHDVVIVVGLVAVSGWIHDTVIGSALLIDSFKIDLPMVAAMLTVIGYSVNDTIVVFDRIRENRGKLSAVSLQVINDSINQTLPRTLLTSFTTFMVVFIMYVWGGPAIHPYNYALLAGILFGTYSSIAIASPLIVGFKRAIVGKVAPTST